MATDCIAQVTFNFDPKRKPVVAVFDAEHASSDGGAILLKGIDTQLGLTKRLTACLQDERQPGKIQHQTLELFRQRVFGIACGYADCNDAARLADDALHKLLLERDPIAGPALASRHFLELGTGTGVGTAWLLAGMDPASRLVSVDNDVNVVQIARRHLGRDARVTLHLMDGAAFLEHAAPQQFDLIYADAWPAKFTHLDLALSLLKVGGIYFIDDLLPQASWPDGHAPNVPALIADLEQRRGFVSTQFAWASGLMMLVRTDRV